MAPTLTSRLQLSKPDPNDFVQVLVDLDANFDKIDLLGKKASPIANPFIKRNTADASNSGTNVMFDTLSLPFSANHWYDVIMMLQYNTSTATAGTPNGTGNLHLKAGGSVVIGDPIISTGNIATNNQTNPKWSTGTVFDVPTDGTYTIGFSCNAGGAVTLNILASGGTDNTGNKRCLWVRDLGEK